MTGPSHASDPDGPLLDPGVRELVASDVAALGGAGVSGTVLLARAGAPVLQECVGLADRVAAAPVTPRTRFQTASVSKMLTAVAVLDQVGQGRLAVTTPVVDVVPPGRRPRDLAPEVTVHHLLTHTSGLADYFEEDDDLRPADVGEDYAELWRRVPPSTMERPVDFLPLYADRPAYGPPGETWRYSNAGYVLLGEVLEQVAGAPVADVVTARVLTRAGMRSSGYDRSDDPRPDAAVHYRPDGRTNVHAVPVVGGGDGGCVCTAADLVRLCRAVADGSLLGDLGAEATRRHSDLGDGFSYGYGVVVGPDGRFGHGGGDPGVSASVSHWPDLDVTLVALCNVEETDELDPAHALRDAVLDRIDLRAVGRDV